jgi:hypothetical protein
MFGSLIPHLVDPAETEEYCAEKILVIDTHPLPTCPPFMVFRILGSSMHDGTIFPFYLKLAVLKFKA